MPPAFKLLLLSIALVTILVVKFFNNRKAESRPMTQAESLPPPPASAIGKKIDLKISKVGWSEIGISTLAEFLILGVAGFSSSIGNPSETPPAIFILALLIFPVYCAYRFQTERNLLINGRRTRGVVVATTPAGRGRSYSYFDFLDSTGRVVRGCSSTSNSAAPEEGSHVMLYFINDRPQKNGLEQSLVWEIAGD